MQMQKFSLWPPVHQNSRSSCSRRRSAATTIMPSMNGEQHTDKKRSEREHVHPSIHCNAWTHTYIRVGGSGNRYEERVCGQGVWSDKAKLQTLSTLLTSAVEDFNKDEAARARSARAHNFSLVKCNTRATPEWTLSRVGQRKTGYP